MTNHDVRYANAVLYARGRGLTEHEAHMFAAYVADREEMVASLFDEWQATL